MTPHEIEAVRAGALAAERLEEIAERTLYDYEQAPEFALGDVHYLLQHVKILQQRAAAQTPPAGWVAVADGLPELNKGRPGVWKSSLDVLLWFDGQLAPCVGYYDYRAGNWRTYDADYENEDITCWQAITPPVAPAGTPARG